METTMQAQSSTPSRGSRLVRVGVAAFGSYQLAIALFMVVAPMTFYEAIGRKGGLRVSQNKQHMASIGRKGGQAVSADRDHWRTSAVVAARPPSARAGSARSWSARCR